MGVKLLCRGVHLMHIYKKGTKMINNKDKRGMQIKKYLWYCAKSHKSCLVALVLKRQLCHIEYLLMKIGQKNRTIYVYLSLSTNIKMHIFN